jgi:hypothetical protein
LNSRFVFGNASEKFELNRHNVHPPIVPARIFTLQMVGTFCGLLWLCSCATQRPARLPLPAEVPFDTRADHKLPIIVTVRMADGEELPLMLDTGSPLCTFDHSVEPKLGKLLHSENLWVLYTGTNSVSGQYAAPRLYLGNTPLATGLVAVTWDFKPMSDRVGRPILGILGMDVLRHYCLQLDFAAGKLRFLDSSQNGSHKTWPSLSADIFQRTSGPA